MEGDYCFEMEKFTIEKNKDNSVTMGITYIDEISIFGLNLKELEFTVEKDLPKLRHFASNCSELPTENSQCGLYKAEKFMTDKCNLL